MFLIQYSVFIIDILYNSLTESTSKKNTPFSKVLRWRAKSNVSCSSSFDQHLSKWTSSLAERTSWWCYPELLPSSVPLPSRCTSPPWWGGLLDITAIKQGVSSQCPTHTIFFTTAFIEQIPHPTSLYTPLHPHTLHREGGFVAIDLLAFDLWVVGWSVRWVSLRGP